MGPRVGLNGLEKGKNLLPVTGIELRILTHGLVTVTMTSSAPPEESTVVMRIGNAHLKFLVAKKLL